MAEEDIFDNAAPNLFRNDFDWKMKGWAESVKLLKASGPQRHPDKQFFPRSGTAPPLRGSGHANRGREWPRNNRNLFPGVKSKYESVPLSKMCYCI